MSVFELRYDRGGVFLPRLGLWLDPHHRVSGPELAFVSHAHSDHSGAHREIIATAATVRLMHARGTRSGREQILGFDYPREYDAGKLPFQITLLPAGHILGSAMAFLEVDGESLLYTGDFKLRPGLAAEVCAPRPADWLVMETTFGRPEYRLPSTENVRQQIIAFCREALAEDTIPILLAYSLGKTQELLRTLDGASLPIALHDAAWKLTRIYEEFGMKFPAYERHEPGNGAGRVLISPILSGRTAREQLGGTARTAVVTGWAMDTACRYRHQADAAFALSDHADFPDLLEFVRRVSPRKVYTLHGFAADFAQTLRELKHDAQALSEQEQFQLDLSPRRDSCPQTRASSPQESNFGG
jgi:Cft2 family RNA processing exonuclease